MKAEARMKLRPTVLLLSFVFCSVLLWAQSAAGRFAIGGNLIIDHSSLTTLAGLEKLTSVGNFLFIENNPTLTSLATLSNIKSIVGLNVRTNDSLTNLEGLNNLARVERFMQIEGNPVLNSVAALSNLKEVAGHLHIVDNPLLTSLAALST